MPRKPYDYNHGAYMYGSTTGDVYAATIFYSNPTMLRVISEAWVPIDIEPMLTGDCVNELLRGNVVFIHVDQITELRRTWDELCKMDEWPSSIDDLPEALRDTRLERGVLNAIRTNWISLRHVIKLFVNGGATL